MGNSHVNNSGHSLNCEMADFYSNEIKKATVKYNRCVDKGKECEKLAEHLATLRSHFKEETHQCYMRTS